MNFIAFITLVIVAALLAVIFHHPTRAYFKDALHNLKAAPRAIACNIGEGTHEQSISKASDAAHSVRHLLVKFGSDSDHYALATAAAVPLGTVPDEVAAGEVGEARAIFLLGKGSTKKMIANEAIDAGEAVFAAAAGKVQDLPAGAGTYYQVGYALTAAAADNDVIEVQDHAPIKLVIP